MQINVAIKKLREVMDESQQDFAVRLGISLRGLSNYEADRVPPLVVLGRLQQLSREREDVPETVTAAIEQSFFEELPKRIGARQGLVAFSFSADGDGGLLFEILETPEEYAFAMAFQHTLKQLRQGQASARKALKTMFVAAKPFMEKGDPERLSKFIKVVK